MQSTRLPTRALRWTVSEDAFDFQSTASLAPNSAIRGQSNAREALEFGVDCHAPGQNVYVRGPLGSGRFTMVRQALEQARAPACELRDRCYVNNFQHPAKPRLISLPAGRGRGLRTRLRELGEFIAEGLPRALDAEALIAERTSIQQEIQKQMDALTNPLEQELEHAGMKLVPVQQGQHTQLMIFPLVEGEPVPPPQMRAMVRDGKVTEAQLQRFEKDYPQYQKRLRTISMQIIEQQQEGMERIQNINQNTARDVLQGLTASIAARFAYEGVREFLDEVIDDVIETRLHPSDSMPDPMHRYGLNIVHEHAADAGAPVVVEHTPSLQNLIGSVELKWGPQGPIGSDYQGIRSGSLLRADGGYLVLNVMELLMEPGAWRALMRTLRTSKLEVVPPDSGWYRPQSFVSPEPIDLKVRVILIGDAGTFYKLDTHDPDFGDLFKVLVDFDHEITRDAEGLQHYAATLAHVAATEQLPHFERDAVIALCEHGARVAGHAGKITARFGRIADIAREAAYLAQREGNQLTRGEHVRQAVVRTRKRASLPSTKFRDLIHRGTIRLETSGTAVGQINGLAVISSGPLTYGFPARITSSIAPGRAGLINIEGQASLSGSIHTKGFHIIGGLLRHLLSSEHPLAFSASIAFEQSYGGIDGDSASGAEICCLLSALTGIPIRQNLAMTGAIDQRGHIMAIGGVNEKIEGFFDTCQHFGLTGEQGVIIPKSNAGDLMLMPEVVAACDRGEFHIYAVETVHEALEVLTGRSAGQMSEGEYAPDSILGAARAEARLYWERTLSSPAQLARLVAQEQDEDGTNA